MLDRDFYSGCERLLLTASGVMRCRDEADIDIFTNEEINALINSAGGTGSTGVVGADTSITGLTQEDAFEFSGQVLVACLTAYTFKLIVQALKYS